MVHGGPTNTMGIRPMPIAGRMVEENERMKGMTNEDRVWRAQWLKDQELSPREPVEVPQLRKELMNPLRRFYKKPMDAFYRFLLPRVGHDRACVIRYSTTLTAAIFASIYFTYYYIKYNQNDWTRAYGWKVFRNRPHVLPGDPGYPVVTNMSPADYSDNGFKSRKVFLD